ncbi:MULTISPECIES: hypothetical protein [Methylopilaceae]|uniref:Uncharacterized protein n=2 Tax=Methylopilaceae TaxID=3149309 RepID=A0A4V1KIA2_9HYPH|nr:MULTISPECIES: hypothetical protein [Methylocystaceae]QZO00547.1 hypothetical protein K6K41_02110 [Chenggangzhangella methanolivorans]RXF69982.1 hypothetical protein EK403_17815 [Hansschlegelia zhihuaiae]
MSKPTYIVNADANDLEGWTCESLAKALVSPLAEHDVEVVSRPRESGLAGLPGDHDLGFASQVDRIVEAVIVDGPQL